MDLLGELIRPLVALVLGLGVFGLIERFRRADGLGFPWRRRGFLTDVGWWLTTALVTRTITRVGVGIAAFAIAWITLGRPVGKEALLAFVSRPTWPSALPMALEIVVTLIVADLLGYWIHRAFHRGWLWRAHAVHHSSERLDWLAAVRVHPVNDLVGGVLRVAVLVLLGFRPTILAGVVPFLTLYGLLLHANVTWSFGKIGRVVASPLFHRWHHARDVEGHGVNFGGFFTVWDRLFGTFHLPVASPLPPTGIREPMPASFWGQLVHPFLRSHEMARAPLAVPPSGEPGAP